MWLDKVLRGQGSEWMFGPEAWKWKDEEGDGKSRQFEAEGTTFPAWTHLGCFSKVVLEQA